MRRFAVMIPAALLTASAVVSSAGTVLAQAAGAPEPPAEPRAADEPTAPTDPPPPTTPTPSPPADDDPDGPVSDDRGMLGPDLSAAAADEPPMEEVGEAAPDTTNPTAGSPAVDGGEQPEAPPTAAPLPGEENPNLAREQAERARAKRSTFHERFVLDSGRSPLPPVSPTSASFSLRGEFQLRFRANNDLPLQPPLSAPNAITLGQRYALHQWLRLKPRLRYRDKLELVGEIDLPRGLIAGDTTQFVSAARDSYEELKWYEVHPRALYVQFLTPVGLFRVGHQTSHWGMGLLANDGDHPTLFGDYRRGSVVERILFATKPLGKDGPLAVALGGDLVYEDSRARLLDGDRALQGIAAVRLETDRFQVGVYGVVRHQERDREAVDELTPFTERLQVGVLDIAAKFNAPIPGTTSRGSGGFVFGEFEGAFVGGTTTYIRNIDLTRTGEEETVQSFGGAARLGAVRVAEDDLGRWGDIAVQLEWGYASGDADPYDGVTRRFTFNQNHNVGLVLFDHVLAWRTARSATIAQDPEIVNRASPGLQFLPSEGGVFGASYLNPTMVVRPKRWLDLKAGAVLAQTSADFVDPFHVGALGDYANYEGGDPQSHDLGLELDAGSDVRIHVSRDTTIQLGVEGGILFPGNAFRHENGALLGPQYLLNSKLGLLY